MKTERILEIVVAGFVGIILILVVVLFVIRNASQKTETTNTNMPAQVTEKQRIVTNFISKQPSAKPNDRIVLYGSSLITGAAEKKQLTDALNFSVDVMYVEHGSTDAAINDLYALLDAPPKYLIIDVGRYDVASGVSMNDTTSNLEVITMKFHEAGTSVFVVTGVGSDGNSTLGGLIKGIVGSNATAVDATAYLMTGQYREDPTQLNDQGYDRLAADLVSAVRSHTAP
jgi:hypothetical protein